MDQPGLSIQSLEPPVFTIDNFMTSAECQQLAQAAQATGITCCICNAATSDAQAHNTI